MSTVPLVVVDTTIHLASERYTTKGSPAKETIARGFAGHYGFALSPLLIAEIARKFAEKGIPPDVMVPYLANLMLAGSEFADANPAGAVCADPDDLFIVVLSRTSGAWCIVAYDVALLAPELVPPGWKPGEFLGRLREQRGEDANQRFAG